MGVLQRRYSYRYYQSKAIKLNRVKTDYAIADYEALNFLINHIDNIEVAYMYCLSSLIRRNEEFKKSFIALLEVYKQKCE